MHKNMDTIRECGVLDTKCQDDNSCQESTRLKVEPLEMEENKKEGYDSCTQTFWQKILLTALVQAAYLGVTLNLGMIGPSLIDFGILIHSTTKKMAIVFTTRASAGLLSSLLTGYLLDKFNNYLILTVALFLDFVFIAAAPFSSNLWSFLVTMTPPEAFNAAIGMGVHIMCIDIWKADSGPVLQSLNLLNSVGYVLGPAIIQPMLKKKTSQHGTNVQLLNSSGQFNVSFYSPFQENIRESAYEIKNHTRSANFSISQVLLDPQETNIHYAYFIVSGYCFIVSGLLLATLIKRGDPVLKKATSKEEIDDNESKDRKFTNTISILFFIFNIFYGGIEVGYAGLLMTFSVQYLGFTKENGTNLTILLQACNVVVTFSMVFLSKIIRPHKILAFDIFFINLSLVILSFFANSHSSVIWVCTAMMGLGYATVMPASYAWVNTFMDVGGKFSSAFWCGFFVGFMVIPALCGYCFEQLNPMWFAYILGLSALMTALIFTILSVIVQRGNNLCGP